MKQTKENFQNLCYEKYRLQWMLSQGFGIKDLVDQMNNNYKDYAETNNKNYTPRNAFTDLEDNTGLGSGSLWVCMDEFLHTEYQDEAYMNELLANHPAPYTKEKALKLYKKYKDE